MKSIDKKLLTVIAASAVVSAAAIVAAALQGPTGTTSVADPTMSTGATVTATTAPPAPEVASAEPEITGPAPLPIEEQGLPG